MSHGERTASSLCAPVARLLFELPNESTREGFREQVKAAISSAFEVATRSVCAEEATLIAYALCVVADDATHFAGLGQGCDSFEVELFHSDTGLDDLPRRLETLLAGEGYGRLTAEALYLCLHAVRERSREAAHVLELASATLGSEWCDSSLSPTLLRVRGRQPVRHHAPPRVAAWLWAASLFTVVLLAWSLADRLQQRVAQSLAQPRTNLRLTSNWETP